MKRLQQADAASNEQTQTEPVTGAELAGVVRISSTDGTSYAGWNIGYEFEEPLALGVIDGTERTTDELPIEPKSVVGVIDGLTNPNTSRGHDGFIRGFQFPHTFKYTEGRRDDSNSAQVVAQPVGASTSKAVDEFFGEWRMRWYDHPHLSNLDGKRIVIKDGEPGPIGSPLVAREGKPLYGTNV